MRCSNTTRLRGKTLSHIGSPAARWSIGLVLHLLVAMLMFLSAVATSDVLEGGTLMFLHVWKCGGTSLRRLLCDWAKSEGLPCATVASCRHLSLKERKICLVNHKLIFPEVQEDFIVKQSVIAGHFQWGFQSYARQPHFMITTLRNPLELYVSGEMYLNRKETKTLPSATQFVSESMRKSLLVRTKMPGYTHRFVGRNVMTEAEIREATVEGSYNMRSFWLVGVMEQYEGFIAVVQHLVDPSNRYVTLWNKHLRSKLNASPVHATNVLASIDPRVVEQFNRTLSYQWLLYGKAVQLFTDRCQEVLPEWKQAGLCPVPTPPSEYY